MAGVLLVDDDRALTDALAMAFEDAGFAVRCAWDGAEGLAAHRADPADAIVSDVNMPHLDGFTLCRRLRSEQDPVPLILLTSRDTEIDEALGLELGADDYVTKPFSTRVLVARVRALLRRSAAASTRGTSAGHLHLDPERLQARFRGVELKTTLTEFRLLASLARRPGVVFSREQLMRAARGDDSVVAPRIIDTYVRRLRRGLEAIEPGFDALETVVGAGYRWRG